MLDRLKEMQAPTTYNFPMGITWIQAAALVCIGKKQSASAILGKSHASFR
jgi:hypothetical protein